LDNLSKRISEAALRVVWAQWRGLGVRLSGSEFGDPQTPVDPEALLLASLSLADQEPRLRDVVASWMGLRSARLSVQRARNLSRGFPPGVQGDLAAAAATAITRGRDHRWKPLVQSAAIPLVAREKDLLPSIGPRRPQQLILELRAGLGVGVKADVLAYLLTVTMGAHAWESVGGMTDALGYTKAGVRRAADELAEAGFVTVPRVTGSRAAPPRMYRADAGPWASILGHSILSQWGHWREHFTFTAAFLSWHREVVGRVVSGYALDARLYDLLREHPRAFLSGSAERGDLPAVADGTADVLEARLERWEGSVERNG
jgi:hypothetical protein